MLSHKPCKIGIIEIIIFEKRYGCLCGFDIFRRILYYFFVVYPFYLYIFAYYYIGTQIKGEAYDEPQSYLSNDFETAVKSFFVFFENLYIIIEKSQTSQPYGCNQHENHVNVA